MKVLIDTNILLDVILLREPHLAQLKRVLQCSSVFAELDYIVTRDCKDFEKASVPAVTPEEFLLLVHERD